MYNNNSLNSLSGFEDLNSVGGYLEVSSNEALTSLTGLEGLTSIGGYLSVSSNDALTNLAGLENLLSIGGNLSISYNAAITSLSGLDNVTSIGGSLSVSSNDALASLEGLDNMASIGDYLNINYNPSLSSLAGLENLTSIGGNLIIFSNPLLCTCDIDAICAYLSDPAGTIQISNNGDGCSGVIEVAVACGTTIPCLEEGTYELLSQFDVDHFPVVFPGCSDIACNVTISGNDITNLDSLGVITSIQGNLSVYNNNALINLAGLEGLTSVGGYLSINGNPELASLAGLVSLTFIGGNLNIYSNPMLCNCEVEAICAYMSDPNGTIQIYNNAEGCATIIEVAVSCGATLPCLEQGTYELTSQFVVDHFPAVFPGCHDIVCNVTVSGNNITNLDSLGGITSIQGDLYINSNPALENLAGLSGLESVGGYLNIHNNNILTSLEGMEALSYVGSGFNISSNDVLASFAGLEGLTSIGGDLSISHNDALASLAGLENLTFIGGYLSIYSNPVLCNCEVEAICSYLSDPNGSIEIYDNDEGCSSMIEVAGICGTTIPCLETGTYNLQSQNDINFFPSVFPDCSDILCDVTISGDNITSLDSLSIISSIEGNLYINNNPALTGLEGLEVLRLRSEGIFVFLLTMALPG